MGSYSGKKAYTYLSFFVLLNFINMLDRNLLSAFAPSIVSDLSLSYAQFGMLTGIVFVGFYAICGLFIGALADRYNRPRIIAIGVALWSVMTALTGATTNFIQNVFARMFVGVGESALSPSAISMLNDVFPPSKRGTAIGIYYLGVPLGAGFSFILAGVLGPVIGWRNCFFLLGGIGLLLAGITLLLRDPKRGQMEQADDASKVELSKFSLKSCFKDVWSSVKQSKALSFLLISTMFIFIPIGASTMELLWLVDEKGFEKAKIAKTFGALFILTGIVSSVAGAALSDWCESRVTGGRIKFLTFGILILVPVVLYYRFLPADSPWFFACMAAPFIYASFLQGPLFASIQDHTPLAFRATILGFAFSLVNILGIGLGAGLAGLMADIYRQSSVDQPLTLALFTCWFIALISIPLLLLALKFAKKKKT